MLMQIQLKTVKMVEIEPESDVHAVSVRDDAGPRDQMAPLRHGLELVGWIERRDPEYRGLPGVRAIVTATAVGSSLNCAHWVDTI